MQAGEHDNYNTGPHTPVYETFVTHYMPSGPLPELAMSLNVQPSGPAPRSPLMGAQAAEVWFNEVVIGMEAERQRVSGRNHPWVVDPVD